MAMKLYSDSDIQDIADAIRSKNGSSDTYKVSQMATAISNIPSGGGGLIDSFYTNEGVIKMYRNSNFPFAPNTAGGNFGITYERRLGNQSAMTYYIADPSITSSAVGDSIFDHMTTYSTFVTTSSDAFIVGPVIKLQTLSGSNIHTNPCALKYGNFYIDGTSGRYGTPVIIDYDGKILAVPSSWTDAVTLLNSGTLDMSRGISIVGTAKTKTGSGNAYATYRFSST